MWDARWNTKGLPEVKEKFKTLRKKNDFDFQIIENMPYENCMKLKQKSDIVIGDTTSGSYHLTDLEALSQGKPVFSYLDSRSQMVLQNLVRCDYLPFINTRLEEIDLPFIEILKNKELRDELGKLSREWVETYYDDKNLVKFYIHAYTKLLNNEPLTRQKNLIYNKAKTFLFNDLYDMQWEMRKMKLQKKKVKIFSKEKLKPSEIIKNIFSATNEYGNNQKRKIIRIFGFKFKFKIRNNKKFKQDLNSDTVKISFYVSGGFGDFLINANYIWHFCQYIGIENKENIIIDVISPRHQKENQQAIFKAGHNYINNCYIDKSDENYDISFKLHSHLEINYWNKEKVKNLNLKLYSLIKNTQEFINKNYFFAFYHINAYHIALANNRHRLQLADVTGELKIKKEFDFPIIYPENEEEILTKFNLKNKTFITFNHGVCKESKNNQSTKMWQLNHINELTQMFKQKYPEIYLVQLGASKECCNYINNIDINLVGCTTLEDIKVLIKNSILHIDCEGGFAHLRNALHAKHPAVIIFGPTNPNLYGYKTNINLYNKEACSVCCDWVTSTWQNHCLRGENTPPCTNAITAKEVFLQADEYLKKQGDVYGQYM